MPRVTNLHSPFGYYSNEVEPLDDPNPLEELFDDLSDPLSEYKSKKVDKNLYSKNFTRWVQHSLNQILGLRLAEDGISGPQTRSAIRSFQQKQGLRVDGAINQQTESAIKALLGNPVFQQTSCPPAGQKIHRTIYGWSQYKRKANELPQDQQAILRNTGDLIKSSFEPGCTAVTIVQVDGHADYDTPRNPQREQQFSEERAKAATEWLKAYVGASIAARVTWETRGLGATQLKALPTSEVNRKQNRRVEVNITLAPEFPIIVESCNPPFAPAKSINEYIELVVCIESAFPTYTPPDILSLLRQIYYGNKPWTKPKPSPLWQYIIHCGKSIDDPRNRLGGLFTAIRNSQVVAANESGISVDVGHIFTGLEAMCCPTITTDLPKWGRVSMPNEEFATWGGDLGSAAAQKYYDENHKNIRKPWSAYFGGVNTLASDSDLEGDIAPYVLRVGLGQAAMVCNNSAGSTISAIQYPISELFDKYFNRLGRFGPLYGHRYRCFLEAIGGNVKGRQITNESILIGTISSRISNFALPFYYKLVKDNKVLPDFAPAPGLLANSILITRLFLQWLKNRL